MRTAHTDVYSLYERAYVVPSESSEQPQVSAAATTSRAVTKTVAGPAKKAPAKKAPAKKAPAKKK